MVGHIDRPSDGMGATAIEIGNGLIDLAAMARAKPDRTTLGGEGLGNRAPDPAAAAGDQRTASFESKFQGSIPSSMSGASNRSASRVFAREDLAQRLRRHIQSVG